MSDIYDYNDLHKDLAKQGIDAHDVFGRSGSFDKWCDAKGYGQTDPVGKHRGSSQVWFAEYQADPDGACKEPPHASLWHWFLNQFDGLRWRNHPGGRYMDVIVTQDQIDESVWVSAILSPYMAGGRLELRLSVSG